MTTDKTPDVTERLLAVRATINLPGLFFDNVACVDPDRDSIKQYLNLGYLVALTQPEQAMCDGIEVEIPE